MRSWRWATVAVQGRCFRRGVQQLSNRASRRLGQATEAGARDCQGGAVLLRTNTQSLVLRGTSPGHAVHSLLAQELATTDAAQLHDLGPDDATDSPAMRAILEGSPLVVGGGNGITLRRRENSERKGRRNDEVDYRHQTPFSTHSREVLSDRAECELITGKEFIGSCLNRVVNAGL